MRNTSLVAVTALATVGVLLAGCTASGIPIVTAEDASSAGAVLAIRLSPQLVGINGGATDGYVLLVNRNGTAEAVKTGAMDMGQLAWTDDALFFSEPGEESVLTDDGLVSIPRGSEEAYETSRFLTPDGDGFISVYNVGFGEDGYLGRVTTGNASTVTSWDVTGLFDSVSQCGDMVVGVTNLAETGADVQEGAPRTDALVQLYPEPADGDSAILATLPIRRGSFVSSSTDSPCSENTSYTLAFQHEQPDGAGRGHPVLRAWSIDTGEHWTVPLKGVDGADLDIEVDDLLARPGLITSDRYVWITPAGRVYSTDVTTGLTSDAFEISLSSPEMGESQYAFTEDAVVVLDVSDDLAAPLDLSRYNLKTGERTKLMSIPGTGVVHDGLDMIIRDIAIDPAWAAHP